MSTYIGVIAASQKRCNCGAERLTDLFVQQQYMYLTSTPYAFEDTESIKTDVGDLGGRVWGALKQDAEAVTPTVGDLSVGIRNIRRTHQIEHEEISASVSDLGVGIRKVKKLYDSGHESISPSVSDLGVGIQKLRINYELDPDSIDPSVADLAVSITRR